jgi:GTP-binding protein
MFVDIAKIKIKAGDGGAGAVAFHREKYVAAGGPDGGDGGKGGDVVFVVDDNLATLADFRYKRKYVAKNGENGRGSRQYGKKAPDLEIKVPRGTIIREANSGAVMADMSKTDRFIAAKGGKGGWGNIHFATPTRQVPRFAKPGVPGEEWEVSLELKLLADVGLSVSRKIKPYFRCKSSKAKNRRLPFYNSRAKLRRCFYGRGQLVCYCGYSGTY